MSEYVRVSLHKLSVLMEDVYVYVHVHVHRVHPHSSVPTAVLWSQAGRAKCPAADSGEEINPIGSHHVQYMQYVHEQSSI